MTPPIVSSAHAGEHFSTLEVARLLGMAVRSIQLMVDRGELEAWKTPGGHRRISRESVQRWLDQRSGQAAPPDEPVAPERPAKWLLIVDSAHLQNLCALVLRQRFPHVELHVADDAIAGLAMAGHLQPDFLIVDIALPGIDSLSLVTSLRSHRQFRQSKIVFISGLEEAQMEPWAFMLRDVPVVSKARLADALPRLLERLLQPTVVPLQAAG